MAHHIRPAHDALERYESSGDQKELVEVLKHILAAISDIDYHTPRLLAGPPTDISSIDQFHRDHDAELRAAGIYDGR